MVNIFKIEVSNNGKNSVFLTKDTNYFVEKKSLNLIREILTNSFSEELEEEVYIYLHYKEYSKPKKLKEQTNL